MADAKSAGSGVAAKDPVITEAHTRARRALELGLATGEDNNTAEEGDLSDNDYLSASKASKKSSHNAKELSDSESEEDGNQEQLGTGSRKSILKSIRSHSKSLLKPKPRSSNSQPNVLMSGRRTVSGDQPAVGRVSRKSSKKLAATRTSQTVMDLQD
jgi:hypothetical protein